MKQQPELGTGVGITKDSWCVGSKRLKRQNTSMCGVRYTLEVEYESFVEG